MLSPVCECKVTAFFSFNQIFQLFFFKKKITIFAFDLAINRKQSLIILQIKKLDNFIKYSIKLRKLQRIFIAGLVIAFFSSCSTGIESTKKIRMSKEDEKLMAKSQEQLYAGSLQGTPLSAWKKGKKFLAMSDRTLYIFEPNGSAIEAMGENLAGKKLSYLGVDRIVNPDLKDECVILFSDGSNTFRYRTKKTMDDALKEIESSKLPLLADLDLVESWRQKLSGSTLWTRSNLWYDANGNRLPGFKFAKVIVDDVLPSAGDFPMKVKISGPNGEEAYMNMNYTSDMYDSRNFAALFYLSDPKRRYPNITDEVWTLIQRGRVGEGMTKEECKLSIGNPDEVQSGHSRTQTMDIWQYNDGTYLMFEDGLLTRFRQ